MFLLYCEINIMQYQNLVDFSQVRIDDVVKWITTLLQKYNMLHGEYKLNNTSMFNPQRVTDKPHSADKNLIQETQDKQTNRATSRGGRAV